MKGKIAIETSNAPGAVGPYSQAVRVGELLFTSGQLPIDPATGKMAEGTIANRAHQALKNLKAVIEAAGGRLEDVLKTTVFLSDIGNFQEVNAVYAEYFSSPFPARSAFQVAALPLGADIEIEAIVLIN
ncbi:RidA family protein [Desulfopila aestuarii]|uniref:Endoribonuclease L-PSP n=1 Tax=Desulfopila aestuarii DSM 18488 TaxID=1121416 RepID=A0A1M7YG45_9BACT|nr:RidA family protein [Desulfopila aestuarii]SHO51583.1 endoribonuclease L-PSP [Desulfopila aestuarii DSM 18488]